jgi:hypothetical protein
LAHELQYALDVKRMALGLLDPDCISLETRGFVAGATAARLLWPDELPNATPFEREIAASVLDYEENGTASVAARLAGDAAYRQACAAWLTQG